MKKFRLIKQLPKPFCQIVQVGSEFDENKVDWKSKSERPVVDLGELGFERFLLITIDNGVLQVDIGEERVENYFQTVYIR